MRPEHDKLVVIVEETVQHVYLMSPEDPKAAKTVNTLRGLLTGRVIDPANLMFKQTIPAGLEGFETKAGTIMPGFFKEEGIEKEGVYTRFTKVTTLHPDENGHLVEAIVVTPKTIVSKPIRKRR